MEAARETYPKLHASTHGPRHQGETSRQAQAALDEIDRLRETPPHPHWAPTLVLPAGGAMVRIDGEWINLEFEDAS